MSSDDIRTGKKFATEGNSKAMTFISIYLSIDAAMYAYTRA